MELPCEIDERYIEPGEIPSICRWIEQTRTLVAEGLVRPDISELAELLVTVALDGTRAKRGEKAWDVRDAFSKRYIQVKSVWHLPHRRRKNLGTIAEGFTGEIWVVEFARDLSVQAVRRLPGAEHAGKRLRVKDALSGQPVAGWDSAAVQLGLSEEHGASGAPALASRTRTRRIPL